MRILVAEDDQALRHGLQHVLASAGHLAIVAGDGAQADMLLATESFDLLVLDLGLPALDGLDVLKRLRRRKLSMPVLILSARDRTEERIRGLDAGADDYMTKPFELSEFEARVRALLRRGQGAQTRIGNLEWWLEQRRVRVGEVDLVLSQHELIVLESLIQGAGRIVGKDALAQCLGTDSAAAADNLVEVYIHRLRRKLAGATVDVKTVRGLGYLLSEAKQDA